MKNKTKYVVMRGFGFNAEFFQSNKAGVEAAQKKLEKMLREDPEDNLKLVKMTIEELDSTVNY